MIELQVNMKKIYPISVGAAVYAILLVLLLVFIARSPALVFAQPTASNASQVFALDSTPYNMTFGDWSAKWWQWILSIPANINPLEDKTGVNCNVNQTGPVWFLAGTSGGPAERRCIVPEDKAVFFPIINVYSSYAENPLAKTESELLAVLTGMEHVTAMEATVDGVKIENLESYRVKSPLFNFTYPENNIGGVAPGPSQALSDGFWVMLHPLEAGEHTVHFRGVAVDPTVTGTANFVTDVIYHLTVSNSTTTQTTADSLENTTNKTATMPM